MSHCCHEFCSHSIKNKSWVLSHKGRHNLQGGRVGGKRRKGRRDLCLSLKKKKKENSAGISLPLIGKKNPEALEKSEWK